MDFKIKYFQDLDQHEWDECALKIGESTFYHSWGWLDYLSNYRNVKHHDSFICFKNHQTPLAIVPLACTFYEDKQFSEISFAGSPCATPALCQLIPGSRKKLLDSIFELIQNLIDLSKLKIDFQNLTNYFLTHVL